VNVRERIETLAICRSPGRIFQRSSEKTLNHEDGTMKLKYINIQENPNWKWWLWRFFRENDPNRV